MVFPECSARLCPSYDQSSTLPELLRIRWAQLTVAHCTGTTHRLAPRRGRDADILPPLQPPSDRYWLCTLGISPFNLSIILSNQDYGRLAFKLFLQYIIKLIRFFTNEQK